MKFNGKKVLIIGMARSGRAAARILVKRGAIVTIADRKGRNELSELDKLEENNITIFAGAYPPVARGSYDLIIVSPGVPLDIEPVETARKSAIPVIGELELAYLIAPDNVEMYAITGTNGKTTTTALLQDILVREGREAVAGGNIGNPLTAVVDNMQAGVISVEVSSFQLETIIHFKPHISCILNITPDHLDRHKTMDAYINAKAKIFANQNKNDYAILNYEDVSIRNLAEKCPASIIFFSTDRYLEQGISIKNGNIHISWKNEQIEICGVEEAKLRGKHNLENMLCASGMAWAAGVRPQVIKESLQNFPGVRHRMEEVGIYDDVMYINDSKATNPDSAIKALDSFEQPIVLIAGGRNKGSDFADLANVIKSKVRELILVGEASDEIKRAVMDVGFKNIHEVKGFSKAVCAAREMAQPGEVVLLSPACASWDMFDSYEQRGDLFCQIVHSFGR